LGATREKRNRGRGDKNSQGGQKQKALNHHKLEVGVKKEKKLVQGVCGKRETMGSRNEGGQSSELKAILKGHRGGRV